MNSPVVYQIRNTENQKVYVGSTVNFKRRQCCHLCSLRNNSHRNKHLQRAYNKYGESAFAFEILEEVGENNDRLLQREQHWIDRLDACNSLIGYNLNPNASNCGGRRCSEQTKQKLRAANIGKKMSNKTKDKIRKTMTGRKRKPHTEETKRKLREAHMGKTLSKDTKEKISKSLQGKRNPFYGRTHSDETKTKIAATKMGTKASLETRMRQSASLKGRKLSEEHRAKIGLANSKRKISDETRKKMSDSKKGKKLSKET